MMSAEYIVILAGKLEETGQTLNSWNKDDLSAGHHHRSRLVRQRQEWFSAAHDDLKERDWHQSAVPHTGR